MQVIDIPAGATRYPEHDHSHDGQEEVFIVLRGSGDIEIDGERHPITSDTMVRVGPTAKRKIWPGDDGIRVLALGGRPGSPLATRADQARRTGSGPAALKRATLSFGPSPAVV